MPKLSSGANQMVSSRTKIWVWFWRSFMPQTLSSRRCGYKYTSFVLRPMQSPSVSPVAFTLGTSLLFSGCAFSQHVTLVFCRKKWPQFCPHLPSDTLRKTRHPKGQLLHRVDLADLFQMRLILINFAGSLYCLWLVGADVFDFYM